MSATNGICRSSAKLCSAVEIKSLVVQRKKRVITIFARELVGLSGVHQFAALEGPRPLHLSHRFIAQSNRVFVRPGITLSNREIGRHLYVAACSLWRCRELRGHGDNKLSHSAD